MILKGHKKSALTLCIGPNVWELDRDEEKEHCGKVFLHNLVSSTCPNNCLMKRIFLPLLFASILNVSAHGQSPKSVIKKLENEPVIFIDRVNIDKEELVKYDPNDISAVHVYNVKKAIELLGRMGKKSAMSKGLD